MSREADILRLVAQRVALNERLPHPFCNACDYRQACIRGTLKDGKCPLGLKGPK